VISENKVDALKDYKLGTTELLQVKTGDGFLMEAMMIKPPDFDSHKKYPVMTFTYSGPNAPQVRNALGFYYLHVASTPRSERIHHMDL